MRTFYKMLLIIAVVVPTLSLATPADAQILQNILNRATQARDRALQARDRATEARNHAADVRSTIQEAAQTISGQIRDVIADAVVAAAQIIDEELDGYNEFAGGACPQFRQDLVTLLHEFEDLLTGLAQIADPGAPNFSFVEEIGIVQSLPCQVLFPFYRAMIAFQAHDFGLLNRIDEATDAIWTLQPIMTAVYVDVNVPIGSAPSSIDYQLGQAGNEYILNNLTLVNNAVTVGNVSSGVLKLVGKGLQSKRHVGIVNTKLQIHGYAGLAINVELAAKIGEIMEGVGKVVGKVATFAGDKVNRAMLIDSFRELRDNQDEILENQIRIMEAVGARE